MLSFIYGKISAFYTRSVLERVVTYLFVSELIVKVIFELVIGLWYFDLSRQKQYIFYAFLFLDYVFNINSIIRIKVKFNYLVCFIFGFAFVVCQGVIVGLLNGNRSFEIFNDTVPLLVLIINVMWMQSYSELSKKINFDRLMTSCSSIILCVCLFGFLAVSLGRPSTYSATGILVGVYIPLFFAALICGSVTKYNAFAFLTIILFNIQNLNRTSMVFAMLAMAIYLVSSFIKRPAFSSAILIGVVGFVAIGWSLLPEDSNTYKRVVALADMDFQASKGSVGERGEEYRSIKSALKYSGDEAIYFGLGHGGLYNVKHTHRYIRDYGHAHYSWALFNLRYGATGYVYTCFLMAALVIHGFRTWIISSPVNVFISLLCLQSVLYMGTYVNFLFLIAGIQFAGRSRDRLGSVPKSSL